MSTATSSNDAQSSANASARNSNRQAASESTSGGRDWLNRLQRNPRIPLIVAGAAAVAIVIAVPALREARRKADVPRSAAAELIGLPTVVSQSLMLTRAANYCEPVLWCAPLSPQEVLLTSGTSRFQRSTV